MNLRIAFTSLAAAAALISPAVHAVTDGEPDGTRHPNVGLMIALDANGAPMWRCSGTLVSPRHYLTAGHCTDGATTARVYFQQDAGANYDPETEVDPVTGYPEYCAEGTLGQTCATSDELYNYGFDEFAGFPNTRDVGLVILDQPIELSEYGALAAPGSLDRLATRRGQQEVTFTISGYGLSRINPVVVESYRERLMAKTKLVNLRSALNGGFNLQLSANPGGGRGGTCFGDSGGPVFYGGFESNIIVGVTSFGLNGNCRGVDFAYRTDTRAVFAWIRGIVGEEEFAQIEIVRL